MASDEQKIFPKNFKLTSKRHPNKRSNLASFIPLLPGFVLKVIASHFLKSNFSISNKTFVNTQGAMHVIKFNAKRNPHNHKSGSMIMQSIYKKFIKLNKKEEPK